ncbi:MAG: choice-of-anchor J domain-containing protein, partial [Bacteroidales bacterium]
MRKIILILIVCFASVYSSFSQILFLENFENVELKAGVGNLSSAWTLYNDKNIPSANYSYCDKAWKVIKNGNGKVAVSPSWFQSTNTKADRWMVSPPINLNSQSFPFLCFKAKSVDKIDKENYMIAISQTNTQKKAFTDTLLFVNEASADWTEQCIDLKKYKGANVHLAFILQSSDKYALYIDDIEVLDLCKPIVKLSNLSLPLFVSKSMPISFWALANYKSKDSIQSYTINYSLNNHLIFSSKVLNVEIPTFAQKEIPVQSFQLDTNGVYSFSLWLSDFNGIENTVSDTLTQQIEVTDKNYYGKNTLLECFSSSTCGPCAKANPFIQDAYKTIHQELENQDKFFMLKYQIDVPMPGDPAYTAEGKHQFNKYEGAGVPLLRLNGKSYSVDGNWELLVSDLHSQIQKIWNEKTQFQLKASMQRVQNDYKVEIHIENVGAYSHPVLLYLAFTEDSIFHTPQSNGE